MRSRLDRNLEAKTRKKFYLTLLGIILVLVLLFKYGVPLLINLSLFLSNGRSSNSTQKSTGHQFVAVPTLDAVSATNSATVQISGNAVSKEQIKLFVNDTYVDAVDTKDDGTFVFKDVSLQQGDNTIKVKAKQQDSESDFSDPEKIVYKNSPPSLSIDDPQDGQSFSKDQSTITIKGKTDADVKVTINDFWAIVDNNGNYSYSFHLQNGDNQIKVTATDIAGNKTEKSIKVTYSQ
jgi:Glucodextranase, domain B